MILSFHPCYEGDENRLCAGRPPDEADLAALRRADAVVLPQGCRRELYRQARRLCGTCFPNYDARFAYPGKTGQAELFRRFGVPQPETLPFATVADFKAWCTAQDPFRLFNGAFVFKFDWGGEGRNVFLVKEPGTLRRLMAEARRYEKNGLTGFLLQAFVAPGHPTLRVAVVGCRYTAYWRVQENRQRFHSNLSMGATIETGGYPRQQEAALASTRELCRDASIDLAGFDYIFAESAEGGLSSVPLALEINWFFGRRGLGGTDAFLELLLCQIDRWVAKQRGKTA